MWYDLVAWVSVAADVLFQRLFAYNVPPLDQLPGIAKSKTVIITGPTSGIGKSTAKELYRRGANVVLACRNLQKGEDLKTELLQIKSDGQIDVMLLDTSDLSSVRNFVSEWEKQQNGRAVDILINNAGVFNVSMGRQLSPDKIEMHMATNHLGHFLLILLMLPYLMLNKNSRVVNVSSQMYVFSRIRIQDPELTVNYNSKTAYGNSKMAQILTTRTFHKIFHKLGVSFYAVHPGDVFTNVTRTWPWLIQLAQKATMRFILFWPDQGARASVTCAIDPKALLWSSKYVNSDCKPLDISLFGWYQNNGWGEGWEMLEEWMWHWSFVKVGEDETVVTRLLEKFGSKS
eukprot:TRINITY_DN73892_c0_g1_i1.p1 TRINITY_DN73892_c0_g1~~TRINITY_DN73892_c0_g1_i1.p1  ORF type:complete len:369 (-),score=50.51 TRINITY_DN73892_c0_g1_i1:450-1481(-)